MAHDNTKCMTSTTREPTNKTIASIVGRPTTRRRIVGGLTRTKGFLSRLRPWGQGLFYRGSNDMHVNAEQTPKQVRQSHI